MVFQNKKNTGFHIVLIVALIAAIYGVIPVSAIAKTLTKPISGARLLNSKNEACHPNGAWMWTSGPLEPGIAIQVQQELHQMGIEASVEARSYGEVDSCGTYSHQGIDFQINLINQKSTYTSSLNRLANDILPTLVKFGKPHLGDVKLVSPEGDLIPVSINSESSTVQTLSTELLPADAITKKVYVIVYDPLLGNGQKLSQYLNWNDHAVITQQTVDFFSQSSNTKMNYAVVDTTIVTSGWPELIDGFTYTEQEYLAVMANSSLHHEPTGVNYNKIVNSPEFDICGKLNRGEIDEVWIYNGPWFGFYESTLVGPGAFWLNSPAVGGTHNCNKLLPIMGPSPERTTHEAVHNFTHRAESTMTRVYGSWQQNNTSHNWNKFGLVKAQSPNYSYSGCGSSHYPPNAVSDYDYGNLSNVLSNCDDFANYPNLGDPLQVSQPVNCTAWGCDDLVYYGYWFGHFPSYPGCGPDNVANDWWKYFASPAYALYPSNACQADMRIISGNAGVGGTTLSYNDGGPKTVMTDVSGNYFLFVSNHWSGNVTPSKGNYTFTPASRNYVDVQSDLNDQDYTAQRGAYYVNIATGNNANSCTTTAAPCRNIQEAINKASAGDVIYVASGTYLFSTNGTPNVVIINKDLTLSGGWNSYFTSQNGASTIDGANVNNGILAISGTVIVENFIVQHSRSQNSGAIYIVNGNFTLRKSTLRNNVATSNGAGIFLDNGTLNVINSTISGNTATSSGGGIYASNNSGASVNIQNSTIAYNTASTGGGISRTNGTYNITDTIIANNSSSVSSPDCAGTIAMANFNIIENMMGCSITSGSNNLNTDPQIDSNLTGVMLVHMLLTGSPAINAGTASGCPSTDQRGMTRPQDVVCDIGSIEYFVEPNTPTFTPTFTPTNTLTSTPTNTPTFTPTFTSTNTSTPTASLPSPSNSLYLSLTSNQTIGGVASADEDILKFDGQNWSLFFDGSDVGVASPDLFAFSIVDADTILMSFSANVTVNGFTATPQDVLRFEATSLGANTAGTFHIYFDGSDVGFDTTSENIDSLSLLPDGRLLLSTTGSPAVPGISGKDEDVLAFTPTSLGSVTSGSWAMYFDGSDVGLADASGEDVDALDVTSNGYIYLSTLGDFTVTGISGFDEDVFICIPTSLGGVTACNYLPSLYFDGSTWGLSANDVDAFNYLASGPTPTAVPTNTPTNTPSPTNTFTPTATFTATSTSTATSTATVGPSPTPTYTATNTSTPTNTATFTATPTASNTPTSTATANQSCASTYTSQPDATTGKDIYISSGSANSAHETDTTLGIGETNTSTNYYRRALFQFDLSGIPSNAIICSAKLSLVVSSSSNAVNDRIVRVYRLKTPWSEQTGTWNSASTGVPWQIAGASGVNDRESNGIGSLLVPANAASASEQIWILDPAKIQEMVNGIFTNNGFILQPDIELDDLHYYYSSDYTSNPARRPKLVITYSLP